MSKCLFALIALALASSAANATGNAHDGPGGQGGQQRQEIFSKMKQLRIDGIQARISILQTALSCINAATSHEQMKPCQQQEHQATESLKQQLEAKRNALMPNRQGGPGSNRGPGGQGG